MRELEPVSSYDHSFQDTTGTGTDRLSTDNATASPSGDANTPLGFASAGIRASIDSFGLCNLTAGQGRVAGSLNLNRRLGFLGRALAATGFKDSNLEFTSTLFGLGNNTGSQPSPHGIRHGSTFRRPKNPDIRLDCTVAHDALPFKARFTAAGDKYINCNDLSTQVDSMPLVTPSREATGHLETYAEYMWQHEYKAETNHGVTINLNRRFSPDLWAAHIFTPVLAPVWTGLAVFGTPVASAFSAVKWLNPAQLIHFAPQCLKTASSKLFGPLVRWVNADPNGMYQSRSIKRTVRQQLLSPGEHKRRMLAPLLGRETWLQFLRRHIDNWILCPDQFDASGKITFWPKRVFASYTQGVRSSEALSPHNIDSLQPGELLSYSDETIVDRRLTAGISTASSKDDALRTATAAWGFRAPTLAGAGLEFNYKTNGGRSVEYIGTIEEPHVPLILAKSSFKRTVSRSTGAFEHVVERFLNKTHNWQWITQHNLAAQSVYPKHLPSLTHSDTLAGNPILTAARHHHLDPLHLEQEAAKNDVSAAAAHGLLARLRANAEEASEDLTALGRDDRSVQLETIRTAPLYSSVLRSSLAPNGAGRVSEARHVLSYGTLARARYDDFAGIRAEEDVFVRSTSDVVMPGALRKELEVRSTIRSAADGTSKIDGVTLALEIKFAEGHEVAQVNDVLKSMGKLYKNGRPFHLLPLPQPDIEEHNHPKVVRDVCLKAHLSQDRLLRLKTILQSTDPNTVADTGRRAGLFGISQQDLSTLLQSGLAQEPFNGDTTAALGTFICTQEDPTRALQFMQSLCGGTWFAPYGRSGTGTAGRLSREVAELRNDLEKPSNSTPTTQESTQMLATIEGFRQRIQCAQVTQDVYTSGTFRATELRLLRAASDALEKISKRFDTAEVRRHLLGHPLNTTVGVLAAQNIKLDVDLRAQRKRLLRQRQDGSTRLQLREINNKLMQLGVKSHAA